MAGKSAQHSGAFSCHFSLLNAALLQVALSETKPARTECRYIRAGASSFIVMRFKAIKIKLWNIYMFIETCDTPEIPRLRRSRIFKTDEPGCVVNLTPKWFLNMSQNIRFTTIKILIDIC